MEHTFECPICKGKGSYQYEGETHLCRECHQTGKVTYVKQGFRPFIIPRCPICGNKGGEIRLKFVYNPQMMPVGIYCTKCRGISKGFTDFLGYNPFDIIASTWHTQQKEILFSRYKKWYGQEWKN